MVDMDNTDNEQEFSHSLYKQRHHQIFPVLNEAQFDILSRYGMRCTYRTGDILFREGDRHTPMFIVLSGAVEIVRATMNGEKLIATHGPGVFTGEVSTLAGRASAATGRAAKDSEVLVITETALRTLVVAEAELSETIMRAFILRRVALIQDESGGLVLIGQYSPETHSLREFLTRNGQPVAYFDIERHSEATALLERFRVSPADLPVVICSNGTVLVKPSHRQVADAIGLSPDRLDGKEYDVVVVGAGPAGLAAAVYAASEGLKVAVLDAKAPGGQAGASSKIENYFGFPTGISGIALAGRGLSQARKFGAEVAVPIQVTQLSCNDTWLYQVETDEGERVHTKAVVIATGARYRKPVLENLEHYEGRGVYYGASYMESTLCAGKEVIIVGGGNSAGQAAVFLAAYTRHVHILVRGKGLAATMSDYLIKRIEAAANITLHTETEIVSLFGTGALAGVDLKSRGGAIERKMIEHVFLFLGASPNTGWLSDCVALDDKGFVLTGAQLSHHTWSSDRPPHFLETSRPRVFAVGDVRSGSVKRVASAVGEGSAAVQSLHAALAEVPVSNGGLA